LRQLALALGNGAQCGAGNQDDAVGPAARDLIEKGFLTLRLAVAMAHHHDIAGFPGGALDPPQHFQEKRVQTRHDHEGQPGPTQFQVTCRQIRLVSQPVSGHQNPLHGFGPEHFRPGERARNRGDRQTQLGRYILDCRRTAITQRHP